MINDFQSSGMFKRCLGKRNEARGGIGLPRVDSISLSNSMTSPNGRGRRTDHHNSRIRKGTASDDSRGPIGSAHLPLLPACPTAGDATAVFLDAEPGKCTASGAQHTGIWAELCPAKIRIRLCELVRTLYISGPVQYARETLGLLMIGR